ncbi:MAG: serine/threonine protein kinase [Myxococcota bacterium]|jgi:serine/threonine protein kinase
MSEATLPREFGKYVLMRKIAMGGMAEIFKAKTAGAEGFEKEIVIKRILPHFSDDEAFVKMFIDEASITSKLQHANIVQIFDFDEAEGSFYIAMEYVEGTDLKDVIDDGVKKGTPLSVAQCVWVIMELSKGLHYAHTKEHKGKALNIVHRDISPHNAMVSYNGEVKLMDFGIAKAAQRSTKTMAGTVKGKVAYMSPEQARGKPLDGRSDLFALGIMIWEMMTHKRLFLGDSDFETLTAVLKTDAPPPSSINTDVPHALDMIILKALEKDREARYPNVEAFNRELTRWYYSNVADLEKESLKGFLQTLYADKIAEARALNSQDKQLPDAVEDLNQERTVAMPIDPQAAATLLDDGSISQKHIQEAIAAQKKKAAAAEASVAAPVGTGTFTNKGFEGTYAGQLAPERKGKGLLIAIAALLFLGAGGFAAWYFTQGSGDEVETVRPNDPVMAELVISVDPSAAKVRVNGAVVEGKTEVEKGKTATIIAEAPGYETYEEFVPMSKSTQVIKIVLKKERVIVKTIVEVDDKEATIKVNGDDRQASTTIVEGREGDKVKIEIVSKGKVVKTQEIVLDPKAEVLKIESGTLKTPPPEKGAMLLLTVSPTDAAVAPSKGEVERGPDGQIIVKGLALNDVVSVEVTRANYTSQSKTFTVNSENFAGGKIALARKAGGGGATVDTGGSATVDTGGAKPKPKPKPKPAVAQDGYLTVTAVPWAKVSVDGKPLGNTPVKKYRLSPGKHTVKLTKGAVSKQKVITVRGGKTAAIKMDMSE